jgi:hypothetical protein
MFARVCVGGGGGVESLHNHISGRMHSALACARGHRSMTASFSTWCAATRRPPPSYTSHSLRVRSVQYSGRLLAAMTRDSVALRVGRGVGQPRPQPGSGLAWARPVRHARASQQRGVGASRKGPPCLKSATSKGVRKPSVPIEKHTTGGSGSSSNSEARCSTVPSWGAGFVGWWLGACVGGWMLRLVRRQGQKARRARRAAPRRA